MCLQALLIARDNPPYYCRLTCDGGGGGAISLFFTNPHLLSAGVAECGELPSTTSPPPPPPPPPLFAVYNLISFHAFLMSFILFNEQWSWGEPHEL